MSNKPQITGITLSYHLSDDQVKKLNEWLSKKEKKYTGAIGGRFIYSFCDTTLGTVIKVKDDLTKDEIDLSNYEEW